VVHKLYISALVVLLALAGITVLGTIVVATHDAIVAAHDVGEYRALPEAYRCGIEKLRSFFRGRSGLEWDELEENERIAILLQNKRWADEGRLSEGIARYFRNFPVDDGDRTTAGLLRWAEKVISSTPPPTTPGKHLYVFEVRSLFTFKPLNEALPLWKAHKEQPILDVAFSFLAFIPALLLVGLARWLRWLLSGVRVRRISQSDADLTGRGWSVSRNTAVALIAGTVCLTVFLFGFFVWPTPYQYEKVRVQKYSRSVEKVYRINRITGETQEVRLPGS
jgi:hypothetical protein